MTNLELVVRSIIGAALGLVVLVGLCGAVAAWESIQAHRRRLRSLRHVIRAEARMLSTCLRLAMEHYRAANEMLKRGDDQ